ncbi:hypothetical protein ANCDUO_10097 [Ancylostoma duodenale]|uniref:Uncharacterized protein n=1 Tax=Ancylostoma duodenale TaxID=51022 RepID=A0A0C2GL45_9BILA|nr:hypothetical protein ANCDUO_10097 [Ancylostoma duodenale]
MVRAEMQTGGFWNFHYELAHFSPQTWYCNFKENLHNYKIVRHGQDKNGVAALSHELDAIYKAAHVPEDVRQGIHRELCVGKSENFTNGTTELKNAYDTLMSNETLLNIITRMYYYDFIVFNFTLPVPISLKQT